MSFMCSPLPVMGQNPVEWMLHQNMYHQTNMNNQLGQPYMLGMPTLYFNNFASQPSIFNIPPSLDGS